MTDDAYVDYSPEEPRSRFVMYPDEVIHISDGKRYRYTTKGERYEVDRDGRRLHDTDASAKHATTKNDDDFSDEASSPS